ncbi:MAG TPA: hypothetical protein PLH57_01320 [Oligoflexia bacterium]|nr:hypothetical protein [Oligoflexia bacterium]
MRIALAFLGLIFISLAAALVHAAELRGTAYPCRVQLIGSGRSTGNGLGVFGAVRVEFWTMPDCNGGYCGTAYFMSNDAWLMESATGATYTLNKEELLSQYQALVTTANAGGRVWWAMETSTQVPFIYELRVSTEEGAAFCKNREYTESTLGTAERVMGK